MMIYLDNNSSTKVSDDVINEILPFYSECYGNPSGLMNYFSQKADNAVLKAKTILADFFNSDSIDDFIFTSGATESNNTILYGVANSMPQPKGRIIVSTIEHSSILSCCKDLERKGFDVCYIPVNKEGIISLDDIKKAITLDTILISIMGANNEIGTIQPILEIAHLAHEHDILVHSDVTQYISTNRIDLKRTPFDFLTFSGHKIHAPKGIGCIYVSKKARRKIVPLILGGHQQLGMRSGTLNVPGIVGLGKAIEELMLHFDEYVNHIKRMKSLFLEKINTDGYEMLNGDQTHQIAITISITFKKVTAIALAAKLPDIIFSSGSACLEGRPSYVLKEIGLTDNQIARTIRIGISRYTTEEEILEVANRINDILMIA